MLGFYELDIDIDLDRLISEHEIIKEKYDYQNYYTNFDLYDHVYKKNLSEESTQKHIERYKAVQENVEKGWSGISLISTDGSLYNDMTEGSMLASHRTELEKHLPYMFELVEKLEGLNFKHLSVNFDNENDIIISLLSPILLVGLVSLFGIFNLGDIYMWNTVFDTIENGEDLDFLQMFWLLSE